MRAHVVVDARISQLFLRPPLGPAESFFAAEVLPGSDAPAEEAFTTSQPGHRRIISPGQIQRCERRNGARLEEGGYDSHVLKGKAEFDSRHRRWLDQAVSRASLNKDPREVAEMFDGVARRYDVTNDVLSLGQTWAWRRAVADAVAPKPGERILDLAAGTGTSSSPLAAAGADVICCDFSVGMLREGQRRQPDRAFVAGDAMCLPFAADTFDAATISFGLRNIVDPAAGLRELARVTRPGGRLVVCEFSAPTDPRFRRVYLEYLMAALPRIARQVATNPDAYVYLAESIQAWPDQQALAELIAGNGWQDVRYRNLTGGIVALHRAWQPAK